MLRQSPRSPLVADRWLIEVVLRTDDVGVSHQKRIGQMDLTVCGALNDLGLVHNRVTFPMPRILLHLPLLLRVDALLEALGVAAVRSDAEPGQCQAHRLLLTQRLAVVLIAPLRLILQLLLPLSENRYDIERPMLACAAIAASVGTTTVFSNGLDRLWLDSE